MASGPADRLITTVGWAVTWRCGCRPGSVDAATPPGAPDGCVVSEPEGCVAPEVDGCVAPEAGLGAGEVGRGVAPCGAVGLVDASGTEAAPAAAEGAAAWTGRARSDAIGLAGGGTAIRTTGRPGVALPHPKATRTAATASAPAKAIVVTRAVGRIDFLSCELDVG